MARYRYQISRNRAEIPGAIEYSADVLIGLEFQGAGDKSYNEREAKQKNPREIRLVIMKNRNYKAWEEVNYNYYPMFNYYEEDNAMEFTDSQYRAIKESIKQRL